MNNNAHAGVGQTYYKNSVKQSGQRITAAETKYLFIRSIKKTFFLKNLELWPVSVRFTRQ